MCTTIDNENLAVWPEGTYCYVGELEEFMATVGLSDDYRIVAWNTIEAMIVTGALEDACQGVLGHPYWQEINPANMQRVLAVLDCDLAVEDEPCGYCGQSQNPNDMCRQCWDNMKGA